MNLASNSIYFKPNPGIVLCEMVEERQTRGGLVLPESVAASEQYKKMFVIEDAEGKFKPGTELFIQEGVQTPPHPSGRKFFWVKHDMIYGYRA